MKTNLLSGVGNFRILTGILFIHLLSHNWSYGQTLYVDAIKGDDHGKGIMDAPLKSLDVAVAKANLFSGKESVKIILGPGLYAISNKLMIHTAGSIENITFTIEASILPNDKAWKPADLPVIMSTSSNNSDYSFQHCEGLLIGQNNVTIKGLKFLGNPNNTVHNYYPIRRQDKSFSGLNVSQCYFIGEPNSSPIQSAFWASGPGIHVDHCIFHNSKIAFVLGDAVKDFSLTNTIIDGAYNTAIWYGFAKTTANFIFKNNIITNCYYVMVYPVEDGQPSYTFSDSYITGNAHYLGYYPKAQNKFIAEPVKNITEIKIHKSGVIKLVAVGDDGMTRDNLNLSATSAGKHLGAGLFVNQ